MRRAAIFFAAAIIAAGGGIVARGWWTQWAGQRTGAETADFTLPDSEGRQRSLSEWRGKILVVNFWASWCGPCLHEIPEFIRLQEEWRDKGVQFIGVALEDKEAVSDYMRRVVLNYPVLIAGDAGLGLSYRLGNVLNAVPFTLVVDAAGKIIFRRPGELNREQLLAALAPVLAAQP